MRWLMFVALQVPLSTPEPGFRQGRGAWFPRHSQSAGPR